MLGRESRTLELAVYGEKDIWNWIILFGKPAKLLVWYDSSEEDWSLKPFFRKRCFRASQFSMLT